MSHTTYLIDVVVTNKETCFVDTDVHPFGSSDHHLVTTQFVPRGMKPPKPVKFVTHRSMDGLTENVLNKAMSIDHLWDEVMSLTAEIPSGGTVEMVFFADK